MPLLNVADDNGTRVRGAPSNVLAAMLYPHSEVERRNFHVAIAAAGVSYWEEAAENSPRVRPLLLWLARECAERFHLAGGIRASANGDARKVLANAMKTQAVYGQAVGQMLLFMLAHDAAQPGKASVRTAYFTSARFGGKSDEWGKKAWAQHKGVAHLWAAYILRGAGNLLQVVDGRNLEPFLADAEFLRIEAERLPRHGDPEPLQPADKLWRIPEMSLPAPTAIIPAWTGRHAKLLAESRLNLKIKDQS